MDSIQLAGMFRAGELPVADFLSQAESYFSCREPSILAFVDEHNRFERLEREAQALAARHPDPEKRPPLFGMLAGVKDIFHVGGFITRAGSRLPPDELQGDEAASAAALKRAGALILGKTVTTEFAYFTPGPTRNPRNPEHTPGGSSSGSAASVAAALCPVSLGTQTIGSVIRPAAFCGVVGVKPTYERISRDGVIPLSPSLDHVGFFASDISTAREVAPSLYKAWDSSPALDGKPTLGIPDGPYLASASDYALEHFDGICQSLAEAGYELRRMRVMEDHAEIRARHDLILAAEAARIHETWFERHADLYSPKFAELIRRGRAIAESRLQAALESRDRFRERMMQIMTDNDIDLWLSPPTIGPAPKGLDSTGDPVMNLPWTQIGFPAVNLPAGKTDGGLPMGLQVIARWNIDEALLAWAGDIERVVSRP